MNEDRLNEIGFVMNMIQGICEETEIAIIAKNIKGTLCVVIRDARDGKEYVMKKVK